MACLDCGADDMPLDTVLTGDQWAMIHPEVSGELCASCIVKRASALASRSQPRNKPISITIHIDFVEDYQATEWPGGRVFVFLKKSEGYFWNGLEWCVK